MQKILILGCKGVIGGQLMKVFGDEAVGWDRSDIDATQFKDLKFKIESLKPSVIINCVAFNDVDGAEDNRDLAFKLNAEVPANLASICKELNILLVHFSTNYVFDGEKGEYSETDEPKPISVYAKSKYQGELEVQKAGGAFYIVRTAVIFGPKGESKLSKKSFVDIMLGLADKGGPVKAIGDEINSVTYAVDLAAVIKVLLIQAQPFGVYHITNSGQASWYDYAKEIFAVGGKSVNLSSVASSEFPRKAKRPAKSVLVNTKLLQLRPWQEALREFLHQN
jgi:dTDP-4-dehydrorhamnose reductase